MERDLVRLTARRPEPSASSTGASMAEHPSGDASLCPALNPSGGGAVSGSAALFQQMARQPGSVLGVDASGAQVRASEAEESARALADVRFQLAAAKKKRLQPPPGLVERERELSKAQPRRGWF